jgi:tetratricopeptide (TPR) repeat protein
MPFTFSHPPVVVPLLSNRKWSQTGLLIGSLIPDFEFYFKLKLGENIGHSFLGIFILDLPLAILLTFVFHQIVKFPLYESCPKWIKKRAFKYLKLDWINHFKNNHKMILSSIFLGVLSHLAIDGLSHSEGWLTWVFPSFKGNFQFSNYTINFFNTMQIILSLAGLIVMIYLIKKINKSDVKHQNINFAYWIKVLLIAIFFSILRTIIYPTFISFWDVFMMLMGSVLYGIIFASILTHLINNNTSRSYRQFHELSDSSRLQPSLKQRIFLVQKNKLFTHFLQAIIHIYNFINKSQIITLHFSNVKVNQLIFTCFDILKNWSKLFNFTNISITIKRNDKRKTINFSNIYFTNMNIHTSNYLWQYKKKFKMMVIIFTFLLTLPSLVTLAQSTPDPLSPEIREEFIQKALKFREEEKVLDAIESLHQILSKNPSDAQVLLFMGDLYLQAKKFGDAVKVYETLIPLNYESTISKINMSYALFMNRKPAKALKAAHDAWYNDSLNSNAIVNHFNAMLWNIKTKEAEKFLNGNTDKLDLDKILVMKARLLTTSGKYLKGIVFYDSLVHVKEDPNYVMEYLEVLIGKKLYQDANAKIIKYTPILSESQKINIQEKLNGSKHHSAGIKLGAFSDVAQNVRYEQSVFWASGSQSPLQVEASVGTYEVSARNGEKTNNKNGALGVSYKFSPTLESKIGVHFQNIAPESMSSFNAVTSNAAITYNPTDRRMYGLTYNSDVLNFTAELLTKRILSNNIGYVTHIMFDGKTGFFSQGNYGMLNDGNSRMLFFGSFYRLLRTEPTLKTGLNFSRVGFADAQTTLYFAPSNFMSTEVFFDYISPVPHLSKLSLKIQLAAGIQKINDLPWDPSYRSQAELNYKFSGFEMGLMGQMSNVAAASGTGYRFQYFTLNLKRKI